MTKKILLSVSAMALVQLSSAPAFADDESIADLEARIEALETQNQELMDMVQRLLEAQSESVARLETAPAPEPASPSSRAAIGTNAAYSYAILDHAEDVNTKQLLQLQARQDGSLDHPVTIGGAVTAIADYQRSNREDKFGYLMRHPTLANQIGKDVSEAVIHSAQLQTTAKFTDNLTGYIEILYNPEQSFGSGTITDLNRNQTQVRRAYLLWGDLDASPIYASVGKMDAPFGLNDTVSPFTNSTVWHAFAGLAYGAKLGYYKDGLHIRGMAIQGGAQFRAHNAPVQDTSVPSRLNNFAVDANYTSAFADGSVMVGASYQHGSAYCQPYPVFHFNPCEDNNPAYAVYSTISAGDFTLIGEFAETTDVWPGTQVPDPTNPLSQFAADTTQSWALGGRYQLSHDVFTSLEFSRFKAGPDGAPWERQDQWVAGLSKDLTDAVNLFGEYVHVDGFVPLNFLTGGNFPDGSTWSERDAKTDLILIGAQAAF
ncbi:MAG: hypothetical protein HRT82_10325 [Henriciella sp.]|nr:hypothetical protein [Henriciella sp.]